MNEKVEYLVVLIALFCIAMIHRDYHNNLDGYRRGSLPFPKVLDLFYGVRGSVSAKQNERSQYRQVRMWLRFYTLLALICFGFIVFIVKVILWN